MLEPEIRYCTTNDGVSIAYWTLGEGPPLVYIAEPVLTSTAGDYKTPTTRDWHERLASRRTVIRFDHRGMGLSGHNGDYSLDALCLDLAAVVDALPFSSFDLWGDLDGGIIAAAYAARHAGRVSHLILWNSWARAQDVPESETLRTLDRLIDLNWPLYARTVATLDSGWSAEEAGDYARYIEAGCKAAIARAFVNATWEFDIESLLPEISCPTLVLHRRDHRYMPLDLGRRLAAGIPGARLSVIEGTSFYPWFEHSDTIFRLVDAFAPVPADASKPAVPQHPGASGTAIILFADIVDSTALTERMGDAAFRDRARALDSSLRAIITATGGSVIDAKTLGDGVLATFPAASQAIDAAMSCAAAGDEHSLPLHLGLHAGDVIREQNNVFGGAVNIASRISGLSAPGEVLVSDVVRALARTSASVTFEDRGEHALKGVGEPQRVYAVWKAGT
jgi:class 3 adenylate cyclase/pimeloyl-ACP methyl ester carboxylesterase